jgi:selenocysteine-specific elongation factor
LGAGEFLAKLVLLEHDELGPGGTAYAQLRLLSPLAAKRGDRFVLRFYSPTVTVGGGEVLDASPLKRRRHKPEIIRQFETRENGTIAERLDLALRERPGTFAPLEEILERADLDKAQGKSWAHTLAAKGFVKKLTDDVFIHQREMETLRARLLRLLDNWHKANPTSLGRSQEEMRVRLFPAAGQLAAESFFEQLENEKIIKREAGSIRLAKFEPQVDAAENELTARLGAAYLGFAFAPPATSTVEKTENPAAARQRRAAFAALIKGGEIIRLDDLYHIHKTHYLAAVKKFKQMAEGGHSVEVGEFRDALGTSRKVAVALLDMFDQTGLSRRKGEGRVLQ